MKKTLFRKDKCKKPILFLARLYAPHIGGVETHVAEVSRELFEMGYPVIVITSLHDRSLKKHEYINGIEVFRIPINAKHEKSSVWSWVCKHISLFSRARVIHAHDVFWWCLPIRFLLFWKKISTTFHGHEGPFAPSKNQIAARKLWETLAFKNVCVGSWMKKYYGTHPDAITYGATRAKPQNKQPTIDAVFIGRLADDTGVLQYIRAWLLLKERKVLHIYGDGELRTQVEELAHTHRSIQYHGIALDPIGVMRSASLIFVSRYLGMIDALALEKPVFAHYNNEFKKLYLHVFPAKDAIHPFRTEQECAKILKKFNSTQPIEKKRQEAAQKWAQSQTWNHIARIYLRIWGIT